jgi:hypothetical protein
MTMLNQLVVRYVSLFFILPLPPFGHLADVLSLTLFKLFVSFVTPLYQFRSFRVAHSVVVCVTVIKTWATAATKCSTYSFSLLARSVYHTVLPPPGNLSLHLAIKIPLNLEPQSCILCLWTILLPLKRDRFLLSTDRPEFTPVSKPVTIAIVHHESIMT